MKNVLLSLSMLAALAGGHLAIAAPMGTAFTYQGRLNDGGQPANNLYDLTFTLHDDPVNTASIGTYIILPAVPVTNGLFTVQLNANGEFGTNAFNGQARWLQIGVRTNSSNAFVNFTFLSPRQPLTPAPCALFASNAAQAVVATSANTATTAQSANVAHSVAWADITGVPAGFADGVDNDTTYSAGAGLTLSGANNQFNVNFAGTGSANSAAHSDHQHFSAKWGGSSSYGTGLSVTNSSTTSAAGLYGQQGSGSGSLYPFGVTAGVWGESSQGSGVYGASGSGSGSGVVGIAMATSGTTAGVWGQAASTSGSGIRGLATATTGETIGVRGESASSAGTGVLGVAGNTTGTNYGVSGKTLAGSGAGVYGIGVDTADNPTKHLVQLTSKGCGVFGESSTGYGVMGLSDQEDGVFGDSVSASGVTGHSTSQYGVSGESDLSVGVWGYGAVGVEGISSSGVPIKAQLRTGDNAASILEGSQYAVRRFRVTGGGDVYAAGSFHPGGADFAEMLPAQKALEPGDVLVIGEDGKLARSTHPYQDNVAGVHATKPGLLGGAHDGADLTDKVPLAVVGIVPVKVTNENGSIKPGDKLTTSSIAGHAMKASRHAEIGTVVGKALEGFDGRQGIIQMLVILQ